MQRTMMRSVRSRLRLKRVHKGRCLLDRHVETSEETRSVKGRSEGPDWLEPDLCLLGPSRCGGPALGLGGDAVRREGRFVTTTPEELNAWLGRESGKPVHVATEDTDLAAELKRGLAFVRRDKEPNATKKKTDQLKKARAKRR